MNNDEVKRITSEIEKAKNDALIHLSKSHDEKLKFHFDVIKYTTWVTITFGGIILAFFVYIGVKGYKDIVNYVEKQAKVKAESIIASSEFRAKIDHELGIVVQSRIDKINEIDHRIDALHKFLSEKDQKQIIHNLFNTLDPRLSKIESMEQGAKVGFNKDSISLINANNDNLFMCFGTGALKFDDPKKIQTVVEHSQQYFYDKKFTFTKKFKNIPVVFVQTNFISDGGQQVKWVVSAVKVDNEGFYVDFLGNSKRDSFLPRHPQNLQFSYIAIGK